jgi:hypothetical protein
MVVKMGEQSASDEIKHHKNTVQAISNPVRLTKAGRGWMAACPPHHDKASLTFSEAAEKLPLQLGLAPAGPSGDLLGELTRDHSQVSLVDDQACHLSIQFPNRTNTFWELAANNRDAPDDRMKYILSQIQRRRQRESTLRRDGSPARLDGEARRRLLSGVDRKNQPPVKGNLAYRREILLPNGSAIYHDQQPGLVVASFFNLQPHLLIELPDGSTALVDTDKWNDGGEIIWTKSDQASAIVKNRDTGVHIEVALHGVTTRGFCLLTPPGRRAYVWMMPREPEEVGGQNRPTFLPDGNRYAIFALESLTVDAAVLTEYEDVSGVVVKLQEPDRSLRRHSDHLGASH